MGNFTEHYDAMITVIKIRSNHLWATYEQLTQEKWDWQKARPLHDQMDRDSIDWVIAAYENLGY